MNKSLLLFVAVALAFLVCAEAVRPMSPRNHPRAQNMIHRQNEIACQQQCGNNESQDCMHECLSPTCYAESKKQTEFHEQIHAFKTCFASERLGAAKQPLNKQN